MCARYSITKDTITIQIGEHVITINIKARYNVAPTQKVPAIIPNLKGGFQEVEMSWGWKPVWSDTLLINAQSETVQTKSTFKKYLHQRCLIPADGFYEWTSDKTPIRFTKKNDAPFCFAGLWYESRSKPQDVELTEIKFLILTTTPNESVKKVHSRMPFIVPDNHYQWWFDDTMFETVLRNPDKEPLYSCPVQKDLNNVKNEGQHLILPSPRQNDLF